MLAEMIEKIVGLANAGNQIEVKDVDEHVRIVRTGNEISRVERIPKPRDVHLRSATSFIEFACDHAQFGDGTLSAGGERGSAVYVHVPSSPKVDPSLRFVFSQWDRRDTAAMLLEYSEAYLALRRLEEPRTPKELVRELRTSLHESMCDPAFLNTVRKIDFRRKSDGSQTHDHGKESMGRSVEMQVQANGGELPETTSFELCMFSNEGLGFSRKITCALFVDFDNERISLVPIDDQFTQLVEHNQNRIQDLLNSQFGDRNCDVPVYVGFES